MYRYIDILTLAETLNELNEKFNAWTDKFSNGGAIAGVLTLVFFIIVCVGLSSFANK
ncbi:MAG: hypothetical protein HFJ38_00930 [Bacilli bacterium]|nr:hypothetical protein [Bacilli bacterium]